MKNEEQLLKLFYKDDAANRPNKRPNISKPFIQDGFICATDGCVLVRIDESIHDWKLKYYETVNGLLPPDVSKIVPDADMLIDDVVLSLDDLNESIGKFPVEDYHYKCSDCGGTGYVDWSYASFDATVYHLHDTCPVCSGTGEIDRYTPAYAQFMICGVALCYGHVDLLRQAMGLMEIDKLVIRYANENSTKPMMLSTEDNKVQILMAPQLYYKQVQHIDII